MPDVGLDTTRLVGSVCEVPLGDGVLQLRVPCVAVGVFMDHRCVGDGVISGCENCSAKMKGWSSDLGL